MKSLFVIILLLCAVDVEGACSGAGTSWSCTAGSSIANVQSAINSATDGATITLASGSYTWTSGGIDFANATGATIICATELACDISISGNSFIGMQNVCSGDNTHTYRISGLDVTGSGTAIPIWFYGTCTLRHLRIDHNRFTNLTTSTVTILLGEQSKSAKWYTLIDHNTWAGTVNYMMMKVIGTKELETWASSPRGKFNNVFLEDNTVNYDSATDLGTGCIDAWGSTAVIFRFNTTNNCLVTSHGTTHNGGTVNYEAYQNSISRNGGDTTWNDCTRAIHHQGSGEIYAWGNTFHCDSAIHDPIEVTHYRSTTPAIGGYDVDLERCDGDAPNDGNTSPIASLYGWPCWNQPGRAAAGGSPVWGTLAPMYLWQNTDNATGNLAPLEISHPFPDASPVLPKAPDHIQANRDYYEAVSKNAQTSTTSPFNGTTGMGFGTLANRPTTCTHTTAPDGDNGGGVAYWATDVGAWNRLTAGADGMLYRCTATNTWTPAHYVPYTYPHPAQGDAGVPDSPTSPRIG